MLKQLNIGDLLPGMMVTEVIEQNGPVKIRRVGMVKSEAMIKGLTEMGVSKVEVDFSQSLLVDNSDKELTKDNHDDENTSEGIPFGTSITPTRRLIENERQVEQVDRQLSQQFHNSLFMPAIEEMPSVFQLYAKPISFLISFAVLGFTLGFLLLQSPKLVNLWQASNEQIANNQQSPSSSGDSVNAELTTILPGVTDDQVQVNDTSALLNSDSDSSRHLNAENQLQSAEENEPTQVVSKTNMPTEPESLTNENSSDVNVQEQITYVNGVALQSGERVLGYQAGDDSQESTDDDINPAANNNVLSDAERIERETGGRVINNPNESSSTGAFSDLLRRVNEAAAEVEESEPTQSDVDSLAGDITRSNNISRNDEASTTPTRYQRLDELPLHIQNVLPSMSFSAHMYASEPEDRWVRVNSLRREENEFITDGLRIFEIQSDKVILEYRGERFSINALSDW